MVLSQLKLLTLPYIIDFIIKILSFTQKSMSLHVSEWINSAVTMSKTDLVHSRMLDKGHECYKLCFV